MPQFPAFISLADLDGNDGFRLSGVAAYDYSGRSVASAGDVNGDGLDDLIIGASNADPSGSASGASYVIFGKATGFSANFNLSTLDGSNGFRLDGVAPYDNSSFAVASAGDVNGDGFDDLIVGASGADPNGSASGSSYVVFGKASGFSANFSLSALDGSNGFRLDGVAALDYSGQSVASAGDVNGDGFDDLIIGAIGADTSGSANGASYVVFGKASGFSASTNLSTLDGSNGFRIDGAVAGNQSGISVASAGDVNGDGFGDIIVGAYTADPSGTKSGASHVVFGKASGFSASINLLTLPSSNGFRISGEAGYDFSGESVASAGDVNGDGFDDLIIGASHADPNGGSSGASYVVFGRSTGLGANVALSGLDGSNGFKLSGATAGDNSGLSVSSAGDFNGDGFADVIVGARNADPNGLNSGASYVVFGKAGGFAANIDLASLDGGNGFRIDGADAYDTSGRSAASAGDVNGDGFDDLIIGAIGADPNGLASGATYVVFGHRSLTSVTIIGTDQGLTHNGGYGDDTIDAFDGNDTVNGWEGDDIIDGGQGDDTLIGGNGDDTINGGSGDDTIDGGRGNDTITGGSGSDLFIGSAGEDSLNGGSDVDTLSFAAFRAKNAITVDLAAGTFFHPNGVDVQTLVSIENVVGSKGGDTITGSFVANSLNGGKGNDMIDAGAGNDVITGGAGRDSLTGGSGKDRFDFNALTDSGLGASARDEIADFTVDAASGAAFIDRLDFSTLDAKAGTLGDQAFNFIGSAGFTAEGQIQAVQSGADTLIQINTTSTGGSEMRITLLNFTASTLEAADFIL